MPEPQNGFWPAAGEPPVALVHGWGGTYRSTWSGSALERSLFRAGRTVLGVDLPGHGRTPAAHDPRAYADIAEQLHARLPAGRGIDAVGFSLGGKLLLHLAARDPERFRRLVIAGVGANLFRPEYGQAVSAALLGGLPDGAPASLRAVITHALASGNDPRALSAVIRRPSRVLDPVEIAGIQAKLLIVAGSDDFVAQPVTPLARALPSAHVVVVQGLDHLDTPRSEALAELAGPFLTQADP
ncbi:alpha/beta fold hydrolase [Amycolatopsis sp. CA-128772]|uniref:alpha/beta fold hydrolase n=1 Tax=Amycolatopsis sp. CA-128772 TaxID=2073159 RepID=UPI000CD00572|nr:alpha/beta fold hydrolase [Amycolatopsis sp. CA-128772]